MACKIFVKFPFELKKVASNSIDAAHSISRNISEGYCRRSLKEYLNHLNFALGSCGEFHSCYESFKQARTALHQPDVENTGEQKPSSWSERQRDFTGVDPLRCPTCDQPLTWIGTFFGNWKELQYLFKAAGKNDDIPAALLRPG